MIFNHNPKQSRNAGRRGHTLLLVLIFMSVGLLALAGAMRWTSESALITDRYNTYQITKAAAEAATEKVLTHIIRDYRNLGEAGIYSKLDAYRSMVPNPSEDSYWSDFEFLDHNGTMGKIDVERISEKQYRPLDSKYKGLNGYVWEYQVTARARHVPSGYEIAVPVQQTVQLASVPIFQYSIWYATRCEFTWAAPLEVRGRVHANDDIHLGSSADLTFYDDVTATGFIDKVPWWGFSMRDYTGDITFQGERDEEVASLMLPIGDQVSSMELHNIIEEPPPGEDMNSGLGRERFYNKAELQILVSDTSKRVFVKHPMDPSPVQIPWSQAEAFVDVSKTFVDQREGKTVKVTELDVEKYRTWAATNSQVAAKLGPNTPPNIIYVSDQRSTTSSQMTGVRLVNGRQLPSRGLTVATPNPLYTKGHYNQPNNQYLGTEYTDNVEPAALISDAYTLLSDNWVDSKSNWNFRYRVAEDRTTVNAAIMTGDVVSGGWQGTSPDSGGVMNLPRLLEDWGNGRRSYTINGSIVKMFESEEADSTFQFPGYYYYAPTRDLNFDENFLKPGKQPPGTPGLSVVIRGRWRVPES